MTIAPTPMPAASTASSAEFDGRDALSVLLAMIAVSVTLNAVILPFAQVADPVSKTFGIDDLQFSLLIGTFFAVPSTLMSVAGGWLAEHLAGAARLLDCRLEAFARTQVARRDGTRRLRWIEGPDAVISGTLEVAGPEAFGQRLARGIGRHRAFGFGMLLLRPA